MSGIINWYEGLNSREKNMINILAVLFGLLLLMLIVVLPLKKYVANLNQDIVYYQDELPQVASKVQALKGTNGSVKHDVSVPLNNLVNQTARNFGLKFSRIEESVRNKEMQLRLDDVEFDQLLRWISVLEQDNGLIIDTLRVSDTDEVGKVDVTLKVIRAA